MNRSLVVTVIVAVLVAIGYVEIRLASTTPPVTPSAADGQKVRELETRIAEIEKRPVAAPTPALAAGVAEARPAETEPSVPVPPEDPSPATDPTKEAGSDVAGVSKASVAAKVRKVRALLAKLATTTLEESEVDDLWSSLVGSGLEDEAIKAFQARVKSHPNDPNAHYGLGIALTARFYGGQASQLEVIRLSSQADAAYSKALALDDSHFGARFSKAISYTFYPPMVGKGPEAIKHFEVLVERHGNDRTNPLMKDVYFNLGNEYRKAGNLEKAKAAYRAGLTVFPESENIREALEAMD